MYSLSEAQRESLERLIYCDGFDLAIRKLFVRDIGSLTDCLRKKVIEIHKSNPAYIYNANMTKDEWVVFLDSVKSDSVLSRLKIDKRTFVDEAEYNPEKDAAKIQSEFINLFDYLTFRGIVFVDAKKEIKPNVVLKGLQIRGSQEEYLKSIKYKDVDISNRLIMPADLGQYENKERIKAVRHTRYKLLKELLALVVGAPFLLFIIWGFSCSHGKRSGKLRRKMRKKEPSQRE